MNKKGFAFVEVVVALTILLVALTVLYTTFTTLLAKEKITANYDKPGDKFALYYFKEKLLGTGERTNSSLNGQIGVYNVNNQFKINKYVVLDCQNGVINKENPKFANYSMNLSKDFLKYIKTLNKCPDNAKVVIMGEFKVSDSGKKYYSYAHIYYPKIGDEL